MFRRAVDLESVPVLAAHVIDGHAVLPVAMILEWMAEGAVHRNPGLLVCGVDDFRLFKGVILHDDKPAPSSSARARPSAGAINSRCRSSCGERSPAGGRWLMPVPTVVLGDRHQALSRRMPGCASPVVPAVTHGDLSDRAVPRPVDAGNRVGRGLRRSGDRRLGIARAGPFASGSTSPLRSTWLIDPLAIDGAFQLVGLWTRERLGSNSLPTGVGSSPAIPP